MIKPGILEKRTLSDQALKIIKERILIGNIPPGTKFVVDNLASEFGISRTPVREALSKLVSMGLVFFDGHSYVVASYSQRDVVELFAIRRTLEAMAIREASSHLTDKELYLFRLMCERTANHIKQKGRNEELMIKLDTEFHKLIYEGSNNIRLKNILYDIREKIWLIHRWGSIMKKVDYVETATIEEYLEFLRHLESRDAEKATRLLENHLLTGEQYALSCLGFSNEIALRMRQSSPSVQTKDT